MRFFIFLLLIGGLVGGYYYWKKGESPSPVTTAPTPTQPSAPPKVPTAPNAPTSSDELLQSGRFAEALQKLDKTPEIEQNRDWKLMRVRALDGLGRRREALESMEGIIKTASQGQLPDLLWLQANILIDEGEKDKAGEVFYRIFNDFPSSSQAMEAAYKLKDLWQPWLNDRNRDLDLVRYNQVLAKLVDRSVDDEILQECYRLLERMNARIFYGPKAIPGLISFHTVKYGENLSTIANKYNVAPARIAQVNDLKSWNAIRSNQTLRIIQGRLRIVVNKRRFNMDVFLNNLFFKRYPVGLGRGDKTPEVITSVSRSMARDPSYTNQDTGEVFPPSHPENPIGSRWIGLEFGRGYGIHGTREPDSIGKESSNGCVRMLNEHVEEIYDFVMVGDEVDIR